MYDLSADCRSHEWRPILIHYTNLSLYTLLPCTSALAIKNVHA